jgi:hypothetical protein
VECVILKGIVVCSISLYVPHDHAQHGAYGFLVLLQALLHVQAEFIMAFLLLGFQAHLPVLFKQDICFLGCN